MKPGLNSYKKAYQACEIGLQEKGCATSAELINWLLNRYDIHSMNITPKGLTYYLKEQGYPHTRQYETKPWTFYSKNDI